MVFIEEDKKRKVERGYKKCRDAYRTRAKEEHAKEDHGLRKWMRERFLLGIRELKDQMTRTDLSKKNRSKCQ